MDDPDLVVIATGSEVSTAQQALQYLDKSLKVRLDAGSIGWDDLQDAREQVNERYNSLQDANFELERARITLLRATGELEAWVGADDVASCEGEDIYAKVSPGKRARVQRVATRDRTVAPFVLEVMGPLSIPTERLRISGGTSAEVSAHFFRNRQ